jgi:hydrogenase expression/formation protein HypC
MCLGIPGRVVRWLDQTELMAEAEIDFDGIRKRCPMACVPEAVVGDYVLVHAGIAITVLAPPSKTSSDTEAPA